MDANNGVYTAYLCSAGKYSNANIPGLKKARDESVRASLECCSAAVDEDEDVDKACTASISFKSVEIDQEDLQHRGH